MDVAKQLIGRVVLVRTYQAGVHVGTLVARDPGAGEVLLQGGSRIIHGWSGGVLECHELATIGPTDARVSRGHDEPVLLGGVISIIGVTPSALERIVSHEVTL